MLKELTQISKGKKVYTCVYCGFKQSDEGCFYHYIDKQGKDVSVCCKCDDSIWDQTVDI